MLTALLPTGATVYPNRIEAGHRTGAKYFPGERAAEILTRYRDWIRGAPNELSTAAVLRRMPATDDVPEPVRGRGVVMIKVMYTGDPDAAERLLRPLWTSGGSPVWHGLHSMPYPQAAMGGTVARYLDFFHDLPDPVVAELLRAHEHNGATVEVRHWGGAMAHPGPGAGPVGHRDAHLSVIVDAPRLGLTEAMRPHAIGGSFLNFLADPGRIESAYTPEAFRRLRAVKRVYDPDNVFRVNLNIAPAVARPVLTAEGRRPE